MDIRPDQSDRPERPDRLVSIVELADVLRLPRLWLLNQARAGLIPCLDTPKQLRFSLKAVEAALLELATKGRANPVRTAVRNATGAVARKGASSGTEFLA